MARSSTSRRLDLRHGVAVEVLEQRHDLEEVRALLGHARIDTTQIHTQIRPPQLKRAVAFYEDGAERLLSVEAAPPAPRVSRTVVVRWIMPAFPRPRAAPARPLESPVPPAR